MQCAEIIEAFKPLRIASRPVPEVPDEGLLLKTLYAGICHSDLHLLDDELELGDGEIFRHRDVLGNTCPCIYLYLFKCLLHLRGYWVICLF